MSAITADTVIDIETPHNGVVCFTFGDPEPVLDRREIIGYFQSAWNGTFYEPPISFDGLAKCLNANSHHKSAIVCKANILASCFQPHRLLKRESIKRLALDLLVFGNAFLERRVNRLGGTLELAPALARWTRVKSGDEHCILIEGVEHPFAAGTIHHLQEPDVSQEIYGMPGYSAALESALLNEAATLFRRKYYANGSHAGFILYISDPAQNPDDIDAIRKALKEAKGPGNFRNLFLYSPAGKENGIKVIPLADVSAKDEFLNMKNVTRDDVLAAHRVPPQLLGIIPNNTGGFGDVEKAAAVFGRNELTPLMEQFTDINAWVGEEVISFVPYAISPPTA